MASTGPRNAPQLVNSTRVPASCGMKASEVINQGTIVMMDTSGRAVKGITATGLLTLGAAKSNGYGKWEAPAVDNEMACEYEEGEFGFKNSSAGDLIAEDDRGKVCYVVDDDTVALTSGSSTRSPAGYVVRVEGSMVYVRMSVEISGQIRDMLAALAS